MAQIFKGHVVDEHGFEIEVWVSTEYDSDRPEHVFLMYGGSQTGDFSFDKPNQRDRVAIQANRVAAGEAKRLTIFPDDDQVIDLDDSGATWH